MDQLPSPTLDLEKASTSLSIHSRTPSSHDSHIHNLDLIHSLHSTQPLPDSDLEITSTSLKSTILERTQTSTSTTPPLLPPPDGSLTAWLQVLLGHLTILTTWGLINSFSPFQTHYTATLSLPSTTISWIGSLQVHLLFLLSTLTGRLFDSGHFRTLYLTGTMLSVLGTLLASFSEWNYTALLLTQGLLQGIGNACLFTPTLALVTTYFSAHRSLALGLCATGSAVGGAIFPLLIRQLLPTIGFPWTMRAVGLVQLTCLAFCNAIAKPRLLPRTTSDWVDWAAFRDGPYLLFAGGIFFVFQAVCFAFFYLGSFARDVLSVQPDTSITLVIVLNAVGIPARILPNYLADRFFGPLNVMIPVCFGSGICIFVLGQVRSAEGLYGWAVVDGMFGAAVQALFPAVLAGLGTDVGRRGVRMGMVFTGVSFAVLVGPPVAGALIGAGGGRYIYALIFEGTLTMIGTGLMVVSRVMLTGWKFRAKQ